EGERERRRHVGLGAHAQARLAQVAFELAEVEAGDDAAAEDLVGDALKLVKDHPRPPSRPGRARPGSPRPRWLRPRAIAGPPPPAPASSPPARASRHRPASRRPWR